MARRKSVRRTAAIEKLGTRVVNPLLLLLEQVLEDQGCPDPVPRLHELTAFRDLAEINRRIAELLDQGDDRCSRPFIVALQEYNPPQPLKMTHGYSLLRSAMLHAHVECRSLHARWASLARRCIDRSRPMATPSWRR